MNYKSKYLKYKLKYLSINGGMGFDVIPQYNLQNFQNNLEKLNENIKNIVQTNMSISLYLKYYQKLFKLVNNKNLYEIKKLINYFDKLYINLKELYNILSLLDTNKFNLKNINFITNLFNKILKLIQINSILWKILVMSNSLISIYNSLISYNQKDKNNLIVDLSNLINNSHNIKLEYIKINETINQNIKIEKLNEKQIVNNFRYAFFIIITQIATSGDAFLQIKNIIHNMNNYELNLVDEYYNFHIEFDEFTSILKKCKQFVKLSFEEQIKNNKLLLICKKNKNDKLKINKEKNKLINKLDNLLKECIFY